MDHLGVQIKHEDVQVKNEVGDLSNIEAEVLRLVQSAKEGMELTTVTALTPILPPVDRQNAINNLLAEKRISVLQIPGGGLRLKVNTSTQLSGATEEEQAIFTLIEESKTKGVWIRELRDGSGLSQIQLRKDLKALEAKKLIKTVKAVGTTKKCYMLFDLEPDTALTGGTFYSDQQLDSELINTLVSVCIKCIREKRISAVQTHPDDIQIQKDLSYMRPQEVKDYIVQKRFLNVDISVGDIDRILDIAILDGAIERRADGKVRAASSSLRSSALVSIPCAICPVVDDCAPGAVVCPEKCKYMTDWLSSK